MFNDLRHFLDYLEEMGKLLRVTKEVNTRFDIAAGIRKVSDVDGPALLFENVKGYPGWKVAGGVYATQKLVALALGLPLDADEIQILNRYLEVQDMRIKPKLVPTGPVKEVVIKGDAADLTKLPICTYSDGDAGPYLTAGVEIARHPDTGIQNVSIHRRMVLDKNRTSLLASPPQHLGKLIVAAEKRGKELGIATVLGASPALTLASQIKAPFGVDETEIAGAIRGAPLELVKCETIDVAVPANAEVVIEGVIVPGERVACGPFGEFPGNYITMTGSPKPAAWLIKVTAITMRKNPIFQAMLTGTPMTENHYLKKWAVAAREYQDVNQIAEVKAVNVIPGSNGLQHVVSIRKSTELEPRNIIYTILSSALGARHVVVVDDDIDIFNPEEVVWAVATRVLPNKDIYILPPVSRGIGEPSIPEQASSRWGIDATMPLKDREWYRKTSIPGVDKVDYI